MMKKICACRRKDSIKLTGNNSKIIKAFMSTRHARNSKEKV